MSSLDKNTRVHMVAYNWTAPASGASLLVRPKKYGWAKSLLAIGIILAAGIALSYPDQITTMFNSQPTSEPTVATPIPQVDAAPAQVDAAPVIQTLDPVVPTPPRTETAAAAATTATTAIAAATTEAAGVGKVGMVGVSGVVTVSALEPGMRQRTREQAFGHVEFSLKHRVGDAGSENEGWWSFSLDLAPEDAHVFQNASLVEIRMIIGCDAARPVQTASEQDRVLWQTPAHAPLSPLRTHLGQILRLSVDRSEHAPARSSFKIFANPLVFQTLCDDPYKLSFVAVFRLGNELLRARISLYYHFTL